MPSFSDKSLSKLGTCDPRLQRVFHDVIRHFDCTILEGHRDKERQNQMVEEGKSKVRWPNGKHNTVPSSAVDVTPYPSSGMTGSVKPCSLGSSSRPPRRWVSISAGAVTGTATPRSGITDSTTSCISRSWSRSCWARY